MKNNKKLKISFVLQFLTEMDRGIERSGSNLASFLGQQGHEVEILYWKTKTIGIKKLKEVKYRPIWLMRYYRRKIVPYLYWIHYFFHRPDVVVIYFANHGEARTFRALKKWFPFHLSFIVGYPIENNLDRFQDFQNKGLAKYLDSIIVKSPAMVKGVEAFFGRKIEMVTNGIDLNYFKPSGLSLNREQIRKSYGIPQEAKLMITVAALGEKRKGIHLVMQSMERLYQTGKIDNLYYLVLGDGPLRSFYEESRAATSIQDKIQFAGSHKEVLPFYEAADLFILPSFGEGFPNVLLEAWAMQLPCIVSDADPYPGITTPEIAKMLPLDHPAHLDEWLLDWLDGNTEWQKMAQKGYEHVHATYAWSEVAKRYAAIWEKDLKV